MTKYWFQSTRHHARASLNWLWPFLLAGCMEAGEDASMPAPHAMPGAELNSPDSGQTYDDLRVSLQSTGTDRRLTPDDGERENLEGFEQETWTGRPLPTSLEEQYPTNAARVADDPIVVACGHQHSVALLGDGTVWTWGDNYYGQLGIGTYGDYRTTPVQVPGLSSIVAVAADGDHSLPLTSDGTVFTWGENLFGEAGDGTEGDYDVTPVQVSGLSGVEQVGAGFYHSLALKSDGTVVAWGNNDYGQLGDGSSGTNRTTPVQVSGLSGVIHIAAGALHSLGLESDGTVAAWGNNYYGQLGDGTTSNRTTPIVVNGLSGVESIDGGWYHSVALTSDGTVRAWGYNRYGQLGDGTTTGRATPVQVSSLSGVSRIAAGAVHSLAVMNDGTGRAWGYNADGRLGDGTTTTRTTPVSVSDLAGATGIDGGDFHSLAVRGDGTLVAWGFNGSGQVGDGTTVSRTTPAEVSILLGVGGVKVKGGGFHTLAVKSDGTVWAWGRNTSGQLGGWDDHESSNPGTGDRHLERP